LEHSSKFTIYNAADNTNKWLDFLIFRDRKWRLSCS